ncbi:MAG: 50S ribosomal protein L27 [bacterium]|jgi:large subunit ribosomal protein L27|nr:50S ribosomal protein L27 [bacterium]
MAHKKGQGSTSNGRDSAGKRLGLKAGDGQEVTAGNIIARQRGYRIKAGDGVGVGKDYTLYAKRDGILKFRDRGSLGKVANIVDA